MESCVCVAVYCWLLWERWVHRIRAASGKSTRVHVATLSSYVTTTVRHRPIGARLSLSRTWFGECLFDGREHRLTELALAVERRDGEVGSNTTMQPASQLKTGKGKCGDEHAHTQECVLQTAMRSHFSCVLMQRLLSRFDVSPAGLYSVWQMSAFIETVLAVTAYYCGRTLGGLPGN